MGTSLVINRMREAFGDAFNKVGVPYKEREAWDEEMRKWLQDTDSFDDRDADKLLIELMAILDKAGDLYRAAMLAFYGC